MNIFVLKRVCAKYRRGKVSLGNVPNGGSKTECIGEISLQHASKFLLTNHVSFVVKFLGSKSLVEAREYLIKPRLASFEDAPKKSLRESICGEVARPRSVGGYV